jgi:nucleoid-associated protein YgaU
MKASLANKMMPAENVGFDFNPESLTLSREGFTPKTQGLSTKGTGREAKPPTLGGIAYLEGDEVKDRAEQLLAWCEPGGGMLGKAMGAALGALSAGRMNLRSDAPVLIFAWGPFLMECVLTSISVEFKRFDNAGAPTRGKVTFKLTERPSLLDLIPTTPTSGGLPGRTRHVVGHGESLPLIAAQHYGHPGLWRSIAATNGIDDPFRLGVGTVLFLPSVSEVSTSGG